MLFTESTTTIKKLQGTMGKMTIGIGHKSKHIEKLVLDIKPSHNPKGSPHLHIHFQTRLGIISALQRPIRFGQSIQLPDSDIIIEWNTKGLFIKKIIPK